MSDKVSYPKNQIKIFLAEGIHPVAHALLKAEGFSVESGKGALSESDLISKLSEFHILGIRSKTQVQDKFLSQAKRLLSVGCFCIGTNQVDLVSAKRQGIAVFNAPFSNTRSVAELIMAEIVMLSRKLGDRNIEMHRGDWVKSAAGCFEVRGKTLGIVGYGHIGSQVSVLAESFGMKVLYFDILTKMPMGNSRQVFKLDELLSLSDFVTLHVPETPQTQRMISASQFSLMKKALIC
jgi:D-3-phosphoglycerate dehydrogenase